MILGIDTSNYTTSVAVYDVAHDTVKNFKRPLPVKSGERGLRQSDALFHHVRNLPGLLNEALSDKPEINAVGVSICPRDREDSYMPCFNAGYTTASAIAAATGVPLYTFSHQAGHIAAALYSANRLDLIEQKFVAFHFSGGTSEAVLVTPDDQHVFRTDIISQSLDLKAGQAIDRVGVMLGLDFPCGAELEKLALQCDKKIKIKTSFKDMNPSLSGVENQCMRLFKKKSDKCYVARYVIEYVKAVVDEMTCKILKEYGELPLVYAGGVMSNRLIRDYLTGKYSAVFAQPEFSTDNAAGVAVLAQIRRSRGE